MAMRQSLRPSILFWYGQLLTLFKRRGRALAVFRAVTREDPRHREAWRCLGFLLAEHGQLQAAIEAFEHALALNALDAAAHFNIGFILQRVGRHEEAVARFQRALEIDAGLDRAWYGLGISLATLGRLAEAAARFGEAARLQPRNPFAGYQLAGVWHRMGERDKLRAEYERVRGFDADVAERIRIEFGVG
jgi:tetratricopeptide (TPR) repeat protein